MNELPSPKEKRKRRKGETQKRARWADQSPQLSNIPGTGLTSSLCWQRCCLPFRGELGGVGKPARPCQWKDTSCQNLTWITFQFLNKRTSALWGLFLPKGWVRVTDLRCSLWEHGVPMTISLPWSWPWPGRNPYVDDAAAFNSDAHSFFGGVR